MRLARKIVTMAASKPALARCTLLLVACLALCAAAPLKVPTARKGECWDKMLGEIKASDLPGKVRQGVWARPRCGARGWGRQRWRRPCRCCARSPPHPLHASRLPCQGYGLIFYGDSITESLRGSDKCRQCDKSSVRSSCSGVPQVRPGWGGSCAACCRCCTAGMVACAAARCTPSQATCLGACPLA